MGTRLVRDRALDNWVVPGAEHQVRPVHDHAEHLDLLRRKLLEEATEVAFEPGPGLAKELADLLEVAEALAGASGITWAQVVRIKAKRWDETGGFSRGMVWETSR
jgi:predicted house-cleaning noncanonical NTP pyrophosphatase (MazG superfamily)